MIFVTSTALLTENYGYRTKLKLRKPIKSCSSPFLDIYSIEAAKKITKIDLKIV